MAPPALVGQGSVGMVASLPHGSMEVLEHVSIHIPLSFFLHSSLDFNQPIVSILVVVIVLWLAIGLFLIKNNTIILIQWLLF